MPRWGRCRGKGGDEQHLLRSVLESLSPGDVLLGDAYFATYFLLCVLHQRGVDGVFEQQGARRRTTDFRRGSRLGERDHLIVLTKPERRPHWMSQRDYERAPHRLTVRELSAGGKVLVTTLLCPKDTPKAVLKALYRERWQVELDLRSIKTTLGMETAELQNAEDGGEGSLDLYAGVQSHSDHDGRGSVVHRTITASTQLQAYCSTLGGLVSHRTELR